jgi:hypothetical protein
MDLMRAAEKQAELPSRNSDALLQQINPQQEEFHVATRNGTRRAVLCPKLAGIRNLLPWNVDEGRW